MDLNNQKIPKKSYRRQVKPTPFWLHDQTKKLLSEFNNEQNTLPQIKRRDVVQAIRNSALERSDIKTVFDKPLQRCQSMRAILLTANYCKTQYTQSTKSLKAKEAIQEAHKLKLDNESPAIKSSGVRTPAKSTKVIG